MRTTDAPTGTLLGDRYLLTRPLGAGSSATVYLAEDRSLRREVAVKMLRTGLSTDSAFLKRFRAEAVAVAGLNHPHVLRVFDWGEADGDAWLVTEYLSGGSLRDVLDHEAPLRGERVVSIGAQAADGLAYAHARGFVHRDVKPSNLLFDDAGRVRITDFGVARALAEAAWTEPEGLIGTVRYSSPEQAMGLTVDGKADVYSLALVLYECLTGVVPFAADTQVATLNARVDAVLPDHPSLGPVAALLLAAAAPDPASRLDAASLAVRLGELARTLPSPGGSRGTRHAATIGFHAPSPEELTGQHRVVRAGRGTGSHPITPLAAVPQPVVTPVLETRVVSPADDPTTVGTVAGGDVTMVGSLVAPDVTIIGDGVQPPSVAARIRRRRWPAAAVVAVVLAVAAGGVVYATQHVATPTFRMPRLVGLTLSQARAILAPRHVTLVDSLVQSKTVPYGKILSQHTPIGIKVQDGATIHAASSAGPPPQRLPAVLGRSGPGALAALVAAGFTATIPLNLEAYSRSVPAGRVMAVYSGNAVDPSSAAFGSPLTLQLSRGLPPVAIPSEVGVAGQSAVTALRNLGFVLAVSHGYSRAVRAGNVISTTPAAGAKLQPGNSVRLVVSWGAPATVPSLGHLSLAKAEAWIIRAGLTVLAVHGPTSSRHWTTQPPAGTVVAQGSAVALYAH